MEFKIGDYVRFLNEKGEGRITSINKQFATVEIEDGFEIPFLMTELVKVHSKQPARGNESTFQKETPETPVKTVKVERALANSIAGEESVFLAFVPEDESKLLSSPLQVYLVNNTSYQVVYSYATNSNNEDTGIAVGYIYPNTEKLLHTVHRQEIDSISGLLVQLLFHSKLAFKAQIPVQQRLPLKSSFFTNINKLKSLGGINKHAYLMTVVELKGHEKASKEELFSLVNNYKKGSSVSDLYSESKVHYLRPVELLFRNNQKEIEVDLHIEELTESVAGMSGAEILEFQLVYFRKCMDKAMYSKIERLLFIHGHGNGSLKKAIRDELKNYKGIRVEDGPHNKFAGGATLVLFTK